MIEHTLKNALSAEGLEGDFNLLMPGETSEMVLPHGTPDTVEIVSIKPYLHQNRFEAILAAPSKDDPVRQMQVSGSIERLAKVPVLRDTLQNGDVIGMQDLDFTSIPLKRLNHDMIMKTEDLIGMTPRRILLAGKTIKTNDIQAPRVVDRGETVTMVFQNGSLRLTALGKALQHGAKGDMIRVVNSNSSKTVDAMVSGDREVVVRSF